MINANGQHTNPDFNIVQAPGNCNPKFIVIRGQRTNSGHAAPGSEAISVPMSRDEAITHADQLQADHDRKAARQAAVKRMAAGVAGKAFNK
jgi:hypothetical protein